MNRDQYLAARRYIETLNLVPEDIAGTIVFLDKQYIAEGGTPVTAPEGNQFATAAIGGAAAREAQITKLAKGYLSEAALGHTPPITPEFARESATMTVDMGDVFAPTATPDDPDAVLAAYKAQGEADAKRDAEADAAFRKLQDESPARDAAAAAQALAVQRVNAQRQALIGTGMTSEQAQAAVPDAPTEVAAPAQSSLDRANAALGDPFAKDGS